MQTTIETLSAFNNDILQKINATSRDLWSRGEVAELVGTHPGTVARWERQGKLRAMKFNSRVVRYPKEEILRLLADGRTVA